jgi:RHH-type transcriptional regulator, rel operon repressor / antitoxin RelB
LTIAFPVHQLYDDTALEIAMLALKLPPEIETRLDELARRTGRSKSFYAREAIMAHLDDLEDAYLAVQRRESVKRGESESIPLSEILKDYGLED